MFKTLGSKQIAFPISGFKSGIAKYIFPYKDKPKWYLAIC